MEQANCHSTVSCGPARLGCAARSSSPVRKSRCCAGSSSSSSGHKLRRRLQPQQQPPEAAEPAVEEGARQIQVEPERGESQVRSPQFLSVGRAIFSSCAAC